jgi:hypothetical protein
MAKDFWAGPHPDGWQTKGAGNSRASSVHSTQAEAWGAARAQASRAGGEAYLQGRDGRIRERNTFGKDPRSTKG